MVTVSGGWTAEQMKRWKGEARAATVLRLLSGEPVEDVSLDTGIPPTELVSWRKAFVDAGLKAMEREAHLAAKAVLHARPAPEAAPAGFASVPEIDPSDEKLPLAQHLHYLWVALGLEDE